MLLAMKAPVASSYRKAASNQQMLSKPVLLNPEEYIVFS